MVGLTKLFCQEGSEALKVKLLTVIHILNYMPLNSIASCSTARGNRNMRSIASRCASLPNDLLSYETAKDLAQIALRRQKHLVQEYLYFRPTLLHKQEMSQPVTL